MKIYFAASISGGRTFEAVYQKIVKELKKAGHQVLTEHIAFPSVFEEEKSLTPEEVYDRDLRWLREAERLVAEVSNPSLGVGYEIARALEMQKPVLCVAQRGIFLTKMITGNKDPLLTVKRYSTWSELKAILIQYVNERK
jgi:Asp-tRNA(Asn)/Glu-tRNA(Gln) amidotransferase A subunit family amidase